MQAVKERRERKAGKPSLDIHALRKELILQKNVAHNAGVANFMCAAAHTGKLNAPIDSLWLPAIELMPSVTAAARE